MQAERQKVPPQVCPRHPTEETYLSCSRCGQPVCPRCMVHAAVGIRCPDCALGQRVPTYDVRGGHLFIAGALGVGLSLVGGGLWAYLTQLFGLLGLLLLIGVGFGSGRLISLAVNRKRGRSLQAIAGGSVALGYLLGLGLSPFHLTIYGLFALLLAIVAATSSLR